MMVDKLLRQEWVGEQCHSGGGPSLMKRNRNRIYVLLEGMRNCLVTFSKNIYFVMSFFYCPLNNLLVAWKFLKVCASFIFSAIFHILPTKRSQIIFIHTCPTRIPTVIFFLKVIFKKILMILKVKYKCLHK